MKKDKMTPQETNEVIGLQLELNQQQKQESGGGNA